MDINELIDQAKSRANLASDYALAKALGIQTGIVANWRKGKRHPSNQEAIQLAALARLDEMRVIAEIELRTANSEKKKEFWKHYIESRGITACIAMTALAASIVLTPEQSEASVLQLQNYDKQQSNFLQSKIYIMRINELSGRAPAWPIPHLISIN
ncbi:hypothetical protein GALL_71120 [mine drainage metagenome]|uniref:Uncharacterized protein n=1 Tax=mine drainage metagenome TaxID=410659 RepID=A0A1J5T3W9_9ZZZZ